MGSTHKPLRSSELAQLAQVSTDTLRHYERKGVLARPIWCPAVNATASNTAAPTHEPCFTIVLFSLSQ